MNTTTYRWLLASHIEQTKAHLQRLETELERHDAAEAEDARKHDTSAPTHKVGDPDPTPDEGPWCLAREADGFGCAWRPGHDGPHIAGSGEVILSIWTDPPPVPVEDLRADDFTDAAVLARLKAAMEATGIRAYSRGLSYPAPKER